MFEFAVARVPCYIFSFLYDIGALSKSKRGLSENETVGDKRGGREIVASCVSVRMKKG